MTAIHDGPVRFMLRSPFSLNVLLTVGGYSWAVWKESSMVSARKKSLRLLLEDVSK
jgi:hypothetical protein